MTKVVQIKGSNGSGKTTIVKQLIALSNEARTLTWHSLRNKVYATIMPDIGWVALGNYPADKPMGGCDNFTGNKAKTI